jgi:hypothetical protein
LEKKKITEFINFTKLNIDKGKEEKEIKRGKYLC